MCDSWARAVSRSMSQISSVVFQIGCGKCMWCVCSTEGYIVCARNAWNWGIWSEMVRGIRWHGCTRLVACSCSRYMVRWHFVVLLYTNTFLINCLLINRTLCLVDATRWVTPNNSCLLFPVQSIETLWIPDIDKELFIVFPDTSYRHESYLHSRYRRIFPDISIHILKSFYGPALKWFIFAWNSMNISIAST